MSHAQLDNQLQSIELMGIKVSYLRCIFPALVVELVIYVLRLFLLANESPYLEVIPYLEIMNVALIGFLAARGTERYIRNAVKGGAFLVFIVIPTLFFLEISFNLLIGKLSAYDGMMAMLGIFVAQAIYYPIYFLISVGVGLLARLEARVGKGL